MKIKLKIIATNAADNTVTVRYYTSLIAEADLAGRTDYSISLPIPAPSGQLLADYLLAYAPTAFLAEREAMLAAPIVMAGIDVLIGTEIIPDDTRPLPTAAELAEKTRTDRIDQIKLELAALDIKKIRPLAESDATYLTTLNAQSATLRAELATL